MIVLAFIGIGFLIGAVAASVADHFDPVQRSVNAHHRQMSALRRRR
jgi:hypothetical protein